ncbi:MAG TPA: HD domain-containing protein [Bacteroidales bacterium]|nr:HD domain-containing protein [Bacteroidales bacterium]
MTIRVESSTKIYGNYEFDKVWALASKLHEGQRYGGYQEGEFVDYLSHLEKVTFEVMTATMFEHHLNANLAVKCAMLHDSIEDTPITYSEINKKYGKEVAEGVKALTKNKKIKNRKAKLIDTLERIKKQPIEVWVVKMADRLANLSYPPFYWDNLKIKNYLEESEIIYNYLHEGSPFLAQKLKNKMIEYQRFVHETKL